MKLGVKCSKQFIMCSNKVSLIIVAIALTAVSANLAERQKRQILNPCFNASTDTVFYLFTPNNKDTPDIISNNAASLSASKFRKSIPTRVLIHGWQNNITSLFNVVLREAYFEKGDFNIISVDWSKLADTLDYLSIRKNIPSIGGVVAALINNLSVNQGAPLNSFYVIGHSFGAHIAGYTGKIMQSSFKKNISTIFGLDPALPGYNIDNPNFRLNSTDALYVESIQTSCGEFGYVLPVGQAAFYPNYGGPIQPGCTITDIACSHGRSFDYLAESINTNIGFIGHKCAKYQEIILLHKCTKSGADALMGGEPSRPGRTGIYYLPTEDQSPFAAGQFQ